MADSLSAAGVDPAELMAQVRAEVQEAHMQALVQTLSEKCFAKCVRPSTSLTAGEQACISKCTDRYFEAMTVIYQAIARKAEHAANS